FWSARKSAIEDLISTIQISPPGSSATRSARRPDGSGSSLTTQRPYACRSRAVPRATADAVSDWRPSTGSSRGTAAVSAIEIPCAFARIRFSWLRHNAVSTRRKAEVLYNTKRIATRIANRVANRTAKRFVMSVDYEVQYHNRARVPEHPEIFARWQREGAAYRAAAHNPKLGISYGPSSRRTI